MPMTGRPSKRSPGNPWFFIQLRWPNPSLSALPNHSVLRNLRRALAMVLLRCLRTILPGRSLARNEFAGAPLQLAEELRRHRDSLARQPGPALEAPLARKTNLGVLQDGLAEGFDAVAEGGARKSGG